MKKEFMLADTLTPQAKGLRVITVEDVLIQGARRARGRRRAAETAPVSEEV